MPAPAKTRDVFAFLKKCAAQMRTVAYSEVADAVGVAPTGIGYQLGYIRDQICRERGLPWLNAIAVNKSSWRPGDSFLPAGFARGRDEERMWRGHGPAGVRLRLGRRRIRRLGETVQVI